MGRFTLEDVSRLPAKMQAQVAGQLWSLDIHKAECYPTSEMISYKEGKTKGFTAHAFLVTAAGDFGKDGWVWRESYVFILPRRGPHFISSVDEVDLAGRKFDTELFGQLEKTTESMFTDWVMDNGGERPEKAELDPLTQPFGKLIQHPKFVSDLEAIVASSKVHGLKEDIKRALRLLPNKA